MFKITLTALFIFFTSLNYLSAQDTNNTSEECSTQKFENFLNCDFETLYEKCGDRQSDMITERNFTKQSANNFVGDNLRCYTNSFDPIFGMNYGVEVMYKWDLKKHKNKSDRLREAIKNKEKINMVMIRFRRPTEQQMGQLYDYLLKNKKSSGAINSISEVKEKKKNFALYSFDATKTFLLMTPDYHGTGVYYYLAYVGSDFVTDIINSFLEIDEVKTGEDKL
ncbi:hypothetical protein [Candidatus Pelagibacter sp. HIMB1506]|uniref:hypothetical protein n=1 Tax=Candidatus Pelagibacter sp. HIMB1506 TaxID=3413337 RepID=UPI003F86D839